MLFLLNTRVLDVTATAEALAHEAALEGRMTPSLYRSVALGQRAVFSAGAFEKVPPETMLRIAAQIALASEANGALFVLPEGAASARDVAVRLGDIPLTTMAHLLMVQKRGPLTPGVVNRDVWSQVVIDQSPKVSVKA